MKDVQNSLDHRGITIQKVGVKDLHLPLLIVERAGDVQQVLANVTITANLPHQFKGTHMSRFIEVLMTWSRAGLSAKSFKKLLGEVRDKLAAQRVEINMEFKYFVGLVAPVSGSPSLLDVDCEFTASLFKERFDFILGVRLPFTSVCPCSKEISEYGAHNQRVLVTTRLRTRPGAYLWIEDVLDLLKDVGSCQVYPLLKREDEKYVTERAYENPKFVEDILRDSVLALRTEPRITWFEVHCESFESIHNHSVYAYHTESRKS